jgi:hypothetical protein
MCRIAQDNEMTRVTDLNIRDSIVDVLVDESFIDYPWDKVAVNKAREPLINNGETFLDPILTNIFPELAWFIDPHRRDRLPDFGPDAIEKMRQPLLGYRHFRVGPGSLRILCDLAWS